MTSISWVICFAEEQFVSADAGLPKERHSARSWQRWMNWLIAEASRQGKTEAASAQKNKTAINIEYMKASIRAKVEHPFRIIKQQFGFVKARYKGAAEKR